MNEGGVTRLGCRRFVRANFERWMLPHGEHRVSVRALIPNALTATRILLTPVFVALALRADGRPDWTAGIVFGCAALTDQLDGWLARRWQVESDFGRVLDPVADKVLLGAAIILFILDDRVPWFVFAMLAVRTVLLRLVGVLMSDPFDASVVMVAKVGGWILFAAVGVMIVSSPGISWQLWAFWVGIAVLFLDLLVKATVLLIGKRIVVLYSGASGNRSERQ